MLPKGLLELFAAAVLSAAIMPVAMKRRVCLDSTDRAFKLQACSCL